LIEAGTQAAGEGNRDAGKALLEIFDPAVVGAGRSGAVEHDGFFQLCLLIKRVHALGARLQRATRKRGGEEGRDAQERRACTHIACPDQSCVCARCGGRAKTKRRPRNVAGPAQISSTQYAKLTMFS